MNKFKIIKDDGKINKEELRKYIEVPKIGECFSAFSRCLFFARKFTGRDVESGEMRIMTEEDDRVHPWIGIMMYLILIDHIGKHFELKAEVGALCEKVLQLGTDKTSDGFLYKKTIKSFYKNSDQKFVNDIYRDARCNAVHQFEFDNDKLIFGNQYIDVIVEKIISNFLDFLKKDAICIASDEIYKRHGVSRFFAKKFERQDPSTKNGCSYCLSRYTQGINLLCPYHNI